MSVKKKIFKQGDAQIYSLLRVMCNTFHIEKSGYIFYNIPVTSSVKRRRKMSERRDIEKAVLTNKIESYY